MEAAGSAERKYYLDGLRILALLGMMVIHTAASQWDAVPVCRKTWQILNGYDSLVRLSVPVFVMISGSLFLPPERSLSIKKLYTKNTGRVLAAFFFWSFCYALYTFRVPLSLWLGSGISPGRETLAAFFRTVVLGHYHLWFLYLIAGLYAAAPLLRKIAGDPGLTRYFLGVSFLLGIVLFPFQRAFEGSAFFTVIQRVNPGFFSGFFFYFMLGFVLSRRRFSPGEKRILYILGIAGILFTAAGTAWLSLRAGRAVDLLYTYLIPSCALSAAAFFVLIRECFARFAPGPGAARILTGLSSLTFGMYLVHDFFNILLARAGITVFSFHPILSVPLMSLTVFTGSLVVSFALRRIPFLGKIIT